MNTLVLLTVLCASASAQTITFFTSAAGASSSTTVTATVSAVAGRTAVCEVQAQSSYPSSFTDTDGDSFTRVDNGTMTAYAVSYYAGRFGSTDASEVLTATFSSANVYRALTCIQVSGIATLIPLDVFGHFTTGTTGTTLTTSAFTTAARSEIIVTFGNWANGSAQPLNATATAGSGYTLDGQGVDGTNAVEHKVVSVLQTSVTSAMSINQTPGYTGIGAVSFILDPAPSDVTVTAPTTGQVKTGTFNLTSSRTSNTPGSVCYYVQDLVLGTYASVGCSNSAPYTVSLDSTTLLDGDHTIKALEWTGSGGTGTQVSVYSADVSFTIQNNSFTVVTPTNAQVLSNTVALSATIPPAATVAVKWVLNDSREITGCVEGVVLRSPPWTCTWTTKESLDGSDVIKAVAYNALGSAIAATPNQLFSINNNGFTFTATSPTPYLTVIGSMPIIYTSNVSIQIPAVSIDGYEIKTSIGAGGSAFRFDSTKLVNGTHTISVIAQNTETTCAPFTATTCLRLFTQWRIWVDNGHTANAVNPGVESFVTTVGATPLVITPQICYTDGLCDNSGTSWTYTKLDECIPTDPAAQYVMQPVCVPASTPPNMVANTPPISLSAASGSSTTVTPLAVGMSKITVTETNSGLLAVVDAGVRTYATPAHFTKGSGTAHTYSAGNSIIRTSLFNAGPYTDPTFAQHFGYAAFSAFEITMPWVAPHDYANEGLWQTAWTTQFNTLMSTSAGLGNLPFVIRGDPITGSAGSSKDLNDTCCGPSAGWSPWPWHYALATMKATNLFVSYLGGDETGTGSGYGFNPRGSISAADATCTDGTTSGLRCLDTWTVTGNRIDWRTYGNFYKLELTTGGIGSYGVTGATGGATAWNGAYHTLGNPPYQQFCTHLNALFFGCGTTPLYTFITDNPNSVADGTYTPASSGLGNITINAYSDPYYAVYAGQSTMPNNAFSLIYNELNSQGITTANPVIGIGDFVEQINWESKGIATSSDENYAELATDWTSIQPYYLSRSGTQMNLAYKTIVKGLGPYWQLDHKNGVMIDQDAPVSAVVGVTSGAIRGGVPYTISGFSGSVMTLTTPYTTGMGDYVRISVSGNSDSAVNTNLYAGRQTGTSSVEVFTNSGPSCGSTAPTGTVTFRGLSYTVDINAGNNIPAVHVTTAFPTDAVPGEHVTISGSTVTCWNGTYAWYTFTGTQRSVANSQWIYFRVFVSSSGTGGTVLVNNDHGGWDHSQNDTSLAAGIDLTTNAEHVGSGAFLALTHGARAIRYYSWPGISYGSNPLQISDWPTSYSTGQFVQTGPVPIAGVREERRVWRAIAKANLLIRRVAPQLLGTFAPSPVVQPCPDMIIPGYSGSSATYSVTAGTFHTSTCWTPVFLLTDATQGNILGVTNSSEVPQTVTIPLNTGLQIGTNPISVYRTGVNSVPTNLLTGAQTTVTVTLDPQETVLYVGHPSAVSNVVAATLQGALPSGAAKVSIRAAYGSYPQLVDEQIGAYSCSSFPCTVYIDPSLGTFQYREQFVSSANAPVGLVSDVQVIPGQ